MAVDIRLEIARYFMKALAKDETDVHEAIQDPKKAIEKMGGSSGGEKVGGPEGGGGGKGDDKKTASTSTEAYAVQYVVGKWTTDNQLATSVLKSMNDAFVAAARNV